MEEGGEEHGEVSLHYGQDSLAFFFLLPLIPFPAVRSQDGVPLGSQHLVSVQSCSSAGLSSLILPAKITSKWKEEKEERKWPI